MALSTIQTSMSAGEFAPSMLGRVDLEKYHEGVATMHNFFVNYRGGACSRAGTAYVGICKQPTTAAPPRDIPFQFSTGQGYALEFGDQYMRIKYQGAYVLETAKAVTGVSIAGVFTVPGHGFSNGDWARDTGNVGFNGLTWIVEVMSMSVLPSRRTASASRRSDS